MQRALSTLVNYHTSTSSFLAESDRMQLEVLEYHLSTQQK